MVAKGRITAPSPGDHLLDVAAADKPEEEVHSNLSFHA
jgi:hypothetical protein